LLMALPFEILRLIMCAVRRDFKTRQASLLGLPCVQQFAVSLDRQMFCIDLLREGHSWRSLAEMATSLLWG
jgi:hypothetical protein